MAEDQSSNPLLHEPREPEMKPVRRHWTFLAGIAFTSLVFVALRIFLGQWLSFNWVMNLSLFGIVFVICFLSGIVKVAGKEGGRDIEAGFVGVVKILDAPLPEWCQFLLPSGQNWLIPLIMEAEPIDTREQVIDIPRPEDNSEGFEIESLSPIDPANPGKGTKFVRMLVKVQVRFFIINPYHWYAQSPKVIERLVVSMVVRTMRHIATNGNYPGNVHDIPVSSDLELMMKKEALGNALRDDIEDVGNRRWGIDPIDVIVSRLTPADKNLREQYEGAAIELAQRTSESIQNDHFIEMAKRLQKEHRIPWAEAAMYAALTLKTTTLEHLKIFGGGQALIFAGQGPHQPPNPPTT